MRTCPRVIVGIIISFIVAGSSAYAQERYALFDCPEEYAESCREDFQACNEARLSRESDEARCGCWTQSYQCYRDCRQFPDGWLSQCLDRCPPESCQPRSASRRAADGVGGAWVATAAMVIAVGAAYHFNWDRAQGGWQSSAMR